MDRTKGYYSRVNISLNNPEREKELHLAGDYLTIITITGSGSCEIKLNHRHSQSIDLREVSEISGAFETLFLTTDGGGGVCTAFIGNCVALHLAPSTQRDNRKGSHSREEFSLESVESNKLLDLAGDYLNIISITGSGTCEIKLNSLESETVNLREILEISGAFERIYFTTDGGGGICVVNIGTGPAYISSISEKLWSGTAFSNLYNTGAPGFHARFSATTKKMVNFKINNKSVSYYVYIGKYFPDYSTFIANATYLAPGYSVEFDYIDIYTLAYGYYNGNASSQAIGTES